MSDNQILGFLTSLEQNPSNMYFVIEDLINKQNKIIYAGIALLITVALIGIAILWNQRKIKKMLRELQNQKKEDKP